jgi:DNA-binding NtrC family response regulator
LQVKLLRVLQERRFEPVGSVKTHEVDVRVIAATNVDLARAVQKGQFREDLFYRLNVIPMRLPALKERRSDIPILPRHFVELYNQKEQQKPNRNRAPRQLAGFSAEALEALMLYPWPGNIRELENLVERLAVLKGEGQIEVLDLPEQYRPQNMPQAFGNLRMPEGGGLREQMEAIGGFEELPEAGMDFNSAVDAYENALILRALEKTGWNRNQAAALLKLNRTTLVEKIKKKGLRPPPEAEA